jgi:outer membrane protein OmpA-like peptidoglycan-associated protein
MDRQQELQRPRVSGIGLFGSAALAVLVIANVPANAQTSSYQPATDNVYINWGALNGAAAPVSPAQPSYGYMPAPAATGGLLMPGAGTPRSTLHVAPPKGSAGLTLRKPDTAPKMAAKPAAPAPTTSAAATPVSPPAAAAPKKLAEKKAAPAPAPAPAPAKTVTASAPPPPPAPDTAGAPPPPPMPSAAASAPAAPAVTAKAAAPDAAPKAPEQASTSTATPGDGPAKVVFNGDDTKLSADGQSVLESVIGKLSADESTRVQLMAYAAGEDLTSSKARRISLSRALSVRSYLIEKGVRSTRIDVRALGDKSDGEPSNRVDVNVIER